MKPLAWAGADHQRAPVRPTGLARTSRAGGGFQQEPIVAGVVTRAGGNLSRDILDTRSDICEVALSTVRIRD